MATTWVGANSNNYGKGRSGNNIKKIVVHWIVGKLSAADAVFQNPNSGVSSHYGIGNTVIHQYVREVDTAYHAGNLTVNRQSIGIEHEGGPNIPITDLTYKTSAKLIASICQKYAIPVDRSHIIGHKEVPRATQCPGTLDIDRLVSMAAAIVAPVGDTLPVEKIIFEELVRKSTIADEVGKRLNKPVEEDIIIPEIEKFLKYEDLMQEKERLLVKKDKQLEEMRQKASTYEKQLKDLSGDISEAQEANEEQGKALDKQSNQILSLMSQVEELKNTPDLERLRWYEYIGRGIAEGFRKLFRL